MGNSKKPASGAVAKSSGKSKKTNQGTGRSRAKRPSSGGGGRKGEGVVTEVYGGGPDELELVFSEPVCVGPARYDAALGADTYTAVDYENIRYAIGDHVALYAGMPDVFCYFSYARAQPATSFWDAP